MQKSSWEGPHSGARSAGQTGLEPVSLRSALVMGAM